jgi:hypothetical protein
LADDVSETFVGLRRGGESIVGGGCEVFIVPVFSTAPRELLARELLEADDVVLIPNFVHLGMEEQLSRACCCGTVPVGATLLAYEFDAPILTGLVMTNSVLWKRADLLARVWETIVKFVSLFRCYCRGFRRRGRHVRGIEIIFALIQIRDK